MQVASRRTGPAKGGVVVRDNVVEVEVALAVLEGGHEQVPPVGGTCHVEHLVDFEQLFQFHVTRAQVHRAQVGSAFQIHGEEEQLAFRPPSQPGCNSLSNRSNRCPNVACQVRAPLSKSTVPTRS